MSYELGVRSQEFQHLSFSTPGLSDSQTLDTRRGISSAG